MRLMHSGTVNNCAETTDCIKDQNLRSRCYFSNVPKNGQDRFKLLKDGKNGESYQRNVEKLKGIYFLAIKE
ncbi:hypothetical protein RCL_jg23198.t1 [Rhizophagus clarus]|uniref:Uncharacterized protein n=1 Tax=Rhizophagus clarus TaxID=94130 RepID=A0A8H3L3S5_9GLOM|nr:hypothetical protein RCL_jg23198.t1 [Rhizophagus clarus]